MLKLHRPAGWSLSDSSRQSGLGRSRGVPGCAFCSWKRGFASCYLRLDSRGTRPRPSPPGQWCPGASGRPGHIQAQR